jgi:hypothetical protein
MNAKEMAAQLTGRVYPFRLTREEAAQARAAGLVIVYGASDDLMEFEGAIHDELGAYDGTTAHVDVDGLIPDFEDIEKEDKDALRDYFKREGAGKSIDALWCAEGGYSWTYRSDIPHETFEIVEDGGPYCRGIVFSLADAK